MRWKGVLFDMDGTVLDTLDDLTDAVNHSLSVFSFPQVDRTLVRQSLGNGAAHLIDCCVPATCGPARKKELLDYYKPWYDAHCSIRTQPYPGIVSMMQELRASGYRLAIISNKPDPAVQALSETFFRGLLEISVGESETVRRKPNPDAVLEAARQLGLDRRDCVYVGDSEVDLQTARNAGMDCIVVSWGFRDESQLLEAGADCIVHSAEELKQILLEN